jgi:hypothetical protein
VKARQDLLAASIDRYLHHRGSPLAGYGRIFTWAGRRYRISPTLMVAISGVESGFATDRRGCGPADRGHNPFGLASCNLRFPSYTAAILFLAQGWHGSISPYAIATRYCPPATGCNTARWARTVALLMREIAAS